MVWLQPALYCLWQFKILITACFSPQGVCANINAMILLPPCHHQLWSVSPACLECGICNTQVLTPDNVAQLALYSDFFLIKDVVIKACHLCGQYEDAAVVWTNTQRSNDLHCIDWDWADSHADGGGGGDQSLTCLSKPEIFFLPSAFSFSLGLLSFFILLLSFLLHVL